MGQIPDELKAKVLALGKDDLPIAERRRLYNQMNRRMKHPEGLPQGLVEQFTSLSAQSPKRFELLKAFICDRNMRLGTLDSCRSPTQAKLRSGCLLRPARASSEQLMFEKSSEAVKASSSRAVRRIAALRDRTEMGDD